MTGQTSLLWVDGLRHGYGGAGPAWHWPHLELAAGQSIVCTGPSGSGKTTLLELLAGLQLPKAGVVRFLGQPFGPIGSAARQRVRLEHFGLVFQGFELLGALDVRENIRLPLRLLGYDPKAFDGRLDDLLQRAGLEQLLHRKPDALSSGEQQRVALCRALIHRPKVLLADEPTANLDAANAQAVLDLLLHAVMHDGAGLVCVTHDANLLPRFDTQWSMEAFRLAGSAKEVPS